jgi:hypothetical protein
MNDLPGMAMGLPETVVTGRVNIRAKAANVIEASLVNMLSASEWFENALRMSSNVVALDFIPSLPVAVTWRARGTLEET